MAKHNTSSAEPADHFLSRFINASLLTLHCLNFGPVGRPLTPVLGLEKVFSCIIVFICEASLLI